MVPFSAKVANSVYTKKMQTKSKQNAMGYEL